MQRPRLSRSSCITREKPCAARSLALIVLCAASASGVRAQAPSRVNLPGATEPAGGWHVINRAMEKRREGDREFIHLDERAGMGLVSASSLAFTDGEIEFDTRGRDVFQKSFVGIAYHITSDSAFDFIYLRPFNFRAADSTRHAHGVQFTSYPVFSWEKLRADHPGEFENPVPADVDPNAWIHVRIAVHGRDVKVYLNGKTTPVLSVKSPSALRTGGVGFMVGDVSDGDFSNLKITPSPG
jgi:hypothetical protein